MSGRRLAERRTESCCRDDSGGRDGIETRLRPPQVAISIPVMGMLDLY